MMKNKVLLVTITTKTEYIQLGLYSIFAYMKKWWKKIPSLSIDTSIIKSNKYTWYYNELYPYFIDSALKKHIKYILKKNPTIVGFSCYCWNIKYILIICKLIKRSSPKTILVLGGPEVSFESANLLKNHKYIDIIVRDEGEETFLQTVESLLLKTINLHDIQGITYRDRNKIFSNKDRSPMDLVKIPSPYEYISVKSQDSKIMAIEAARGCPFNCSYCTFSIRANHQLRFFPMTKVKKELSILLQKKIKRLFINDDNFNINPYRATEIIKYINRMNKHSRIDIFFNASMWLISNDLIKLLRARYYHLLIGIQTINQIALRNINREDNISILEHNLKLIDRYKIQYELQLIIGLPGDNYMNFKKTIDWIANFNPKFIKVFPLSIFRDTLLYRQVDLFGIQFVRKGQYLPYIQSNNSFSRLEIKKANRLFNSINILYNLGLFRETSKYLHKNYKMKLSDIAEVFNEDMLSVSNKDYIKLYQRHFIKKLQSKFNFNDNSNILIKYLDIDLSYYWKNIQFKK